jgi:hypothetical protein
MYFIDKTVFLIVLLYLTERAKLIVPDWNPNAPEKYQNGIEIFTFEGPNLTFPLALKNAMIGPISGDTYYVGEVGRSNETYYLRLDKDNQVLWSTKIGNFTVPARGQVIDSSENNIYSIFRWEFWGGVYLVNTDDGSSNTFFRNASFGFPVGIDSVLKLSSSPTEVFFNCNNTDSQGDISLWRWILAERIWNWFTRSGIDFIQAFDLISDDKVVYLSTNSSLDPNLYFGAFDFSSSSYDWVTSIRCLTANDWSNARGSIKYDSEYERIYSWVSGPDFNQIFISLNPSDGSLIGDKYKSDSISHAVISMVFSRNNLVMLWNTSGAHSIFIYDRITQAFTYGVFVDQRGTVSTSYIDYKTNSLNAYGSSGQTWNITKAYLKYPETHSLYQSQRVFMVEATDPELNEFTFGSTSFNMNFHTFVNFSQNHIADPYNHTITSLISEVYLWTETEKLESIDMSSSGAIPLTLTCWNAFSPQITYSLKGADGEELPNWMSLDSSTGVLSYEAPLLPSARRYTIMIEASIDGDPIPRTRAFIIQVGEDSECPKGEYLDNQQMFWENWHYKCSSCTGPTSKQCSSCNNGFKLVNDSWVKESSYVAYVFSKTNILILLIVATISAFIALLMWIWCDNSDSSAWVFIYDRSLDSVEGEDRHLAGIGPVIAKGETSGSSKSQLFWIMISDYQLIETFLIVEAYMDETFVELLESINFLTFNLSFLKFPFVEEFKTVIGLTSDPSRESSLEYGMGKAGFEDNIFLADYMYFFIYLILFIVGNILFKIFITPPISPETRMERFVHALNRYFTYSTYIRLMLESYLFMWIAVFVEYTQEHSTASQIVSVIFGSIWVVVLQIFTVYAIIHYIWYRKDKTIINGPFEAMYDGLRGDWMSKLYTPIFLIRRLFLAIFLVWVRNSAGQIALVLIIHLTSLGFSTIVRPFLSRLDNVINIINEIAIFVVTSIFLTLRKGNSLTEEQIEDRTQIAIWVLSAVGVFGVMVTLFVLSARIYVTIRNWIRNRGKAQGKAKANKKESDSKNDGIMSTSKKVEGNDDNRV